VSSMIEIPAHPTLPRFDGHDQQPDDTLEL